MPTDTFSPFTRSPLHPEFDVADGVRGLRSVMVNVYFVSLADADGVGRWVLIDAGLPVSAHAIRNTAASLFGAGMPPEAILLTHGHFDHVGVLETLADDWDVPVYAHPLELPYLDGRAGYAPPDPFVGGGMSLVSPLYPRGPVDVSARLRPLPSGGDVPFLGEWRWLHTPGHSPGHVSFFRDRDRTLIAGDAVTTCRQEYAATVLAQTQTVAGPPRYFTHDWPAAAASARLLAELNPETLATGHGTPLRGPAMREALHRLADTFLDTEVPKGGRYADRPVVYDESGPQQVPPARSVPPSLIVKGVAIAAAAAAGVAVALTLSKSLASPRDDRGDDRERTDGTA